MSDLVKSLTGALANPSSVDQQTRGRSFFLDEHTTAVPSEGNMLTLLTMKDLFKTPGGSTNETAIGAVAKEESRYLVQAMKILSTDPEQGWGAGEDGEGGSNLSADQKRTIRRMQDKFGKDFKGATELSKLLKTEAVRVEFEDAIKSFVGPKIRSGGGALTGDDVLD